MNAQHSLLAKSLPIVAQALGDQLGVKVIIGQTSGASTDGKNIYLPALPADDAKTFVYAHGYIDHEAAHIRFSDDEPFKHMTSSLEKDITNLFEDIRIERAMCQLYPGCKSNLAKLAHLMVEDGGFRAPSADEHPAKALACFLLNRLRADVLHQLAVSEIADTSTNVFKDIFPRGVFTRVAALMNKVDRLKCSMDAFYLAREVLTVLKEEKEKAQAQANHPQTSGDQGTGQTAACGADQVGADGATAEASKNDDASANSANGSAAPGDGDASTSNNAGGGKAHGAYAQAIDDALNATDDDLIDDIGSYLADKLGDKAVESGGDIVVGTAGRNSALRLANGEALMREACKLTNGLRARLTGLAQSHAKVSDVYRQDGQTLAVNRLHRVATGELDVFKHKRRSAAVNTAFQLLLDCSSSMRDDMYTAKLAALASAHALDLIKGVTVGTSAFPGFAGNEVEIVSMLGEKVRFMAPYYDIQAHGNTPMAAAMWWAATQLMHRDEPRKILMVVTDGEPNGGTEHSIDTLIDLCSKSGIECMALGIGRLNIADKFPINHTIDSANELSNAMFAMMKQRLLIKAA